MVRSEKDKVHKLSVNADVNADMVIDEIIARVIQDDILSELKNKARGIKEYVTDLENAL